MLVVVVEVATVKDDIEVDEVVDELLMLLVMVDEDDDDNIVALAELGDIRVVNEYLSFVILQLVDMM